MRKILIILSFALFSSSAFAERFQDTIHSISKGINGEEHIVKLVSGRVVFLESEAEIASPEDLAAGNRVELEVDDRLSLQSITSLPHEAMPEEEGPILDELENDKATVLPNYEAAKSIFNGMNRSYKRVSECSDRAHVWSYEEWKKKGLVSKKVFLFFTNTYIRNYRFNWWFHVSPYTLVRERGAIVEHVMDRRYTSYPYHMKPWTDVFVRSKKSCPVTTYAHYRANKNGPEHCFMVKTSMYYRLPYHVRMMEDRGQFKNRFSTSEVNFSYRAFTRRGAKKAGE